MEWSPQQDSAIREARQWLKEGTQQVFYIAGYAGTGKTTLAKEIAASANGKVLYGAFTGKAASVMRNKGCDGASTIHSMIYKLKDAETSNPRFVLDPDSDASTAALIILDEVSMVDEALAKDVLSFKKKVLVLGDPAQLPPVSGSGYFTEKKPDVMLTEVHRQARDNPIILMSMMIREGQKVLPGLYGESSVIARASLPPEGLTDSVMKADQVIVGLNRTRHAYNARMRAHKGHKLEMPVRGDKLICLKNNRFKGIYNGGLWEVRKVRRDKKGKPIFHLLLETLDGVEGKKAGVQVREEFFSGQEGGLTFEDKRGTQEFTYGYAITCHKSQGSQWDNIVVFDESASFREDARRWLYTAVTRAAEKITLVVS